METAQDITASQGARHKRPKGIPIERMLQLRDNKLTDGEIATLLGCDRSNVSRRLAAHAPAIDRLNNHKKYRADILTNLQADILDSITEANINDCTLPQKTVAYGILYDKERLERGKSSTNLSVAGLVEAHSTNLEALSADIARLTGELVNGDSE